MVLKNAVAGRPFRKIPFFFQALKGVGTLIRRGILKEGGTQKNIFSEITNINTSGGFEPEVGLTDHQHRYRLRYAAGKVRRLSLPISARPFFSLNTSLNTTRVPTSFNGVCFEG